MTIGRTFLILKGTMLRVCSSLLASIKTALFVCGLPVDFLKSKISSHLHKRFTSSCLYSMLNGIYC